MKKDKRERRRHKLHAAEKRRRRALVSKGRAHQRRFRKSCQPGQEPSAQRGWQRQAARKLSRKLVSIQAPEVFGLLHEERRAPLLRFISHLRRFTLVARSRVRIDFRKTKQMQPDGTLLFAAELDRIQRAVKPNKLVYCNYPKDNVVEQVLQHLGLLETMNCKARTIISAENVREWKMYTDTSVEGELAQPLVSQYERLFPNKSGAKMYSGLTEAMTNCKHHAYARTRIDKTGVPIDQRWWMFAEERDGKLSVAFCDLGIGINRSLLTSTQWARDTVLELVNRFGGRKDSRFIRAAMEIGKTRTLEKNRGNGLQDLKNVIASLPTGYLLIFSNRGLYRYFSESGTERLADYRDSILGTLICWQIPVPKGGDKHEGN